MKSGVGYVLAVVGLIVLAIGLGTFGIELAFLGSLGSTTVSIIGGVLILAGVMVLKFFSEGSSSKVKQATVEVPIYQGDKIVGYRKEAK